LRHSSLPELPIFLRKIRIFAENSCSAHHAQKAGVADNNPLCAGFDQVKAARPHFGDEPLAPDFAVDPAPVAADDTAACHGFRTEDFGNPALWGGLSDNRFYAPILPGHG